MKDENKKKEELIDELVKLRDRIAALEESEIEHNRGKQSVIKSKGMANPLYVIDGPDKGKLFTVSDGITTIGRSPDNDIRISDRAVSRHHAKFLMKGERIFIVDLNSLRGVLINGEKAKPGRETEISKERKVTLGNTTLSFQDELSGKIASQAHLAASVRRPFDSSKSFMGNQRDYAQNLELLLLVSNILSQSLDTDELLGEVIDQIFVLLKRIDRGSILLLNRETGELHEAVSKTRIEDKEEIFSKINYSRTIVKRTIQEGEPVTMSDMSLIDEADLSDSMKQMNVMSVMCVPLNYKGEVRGVIYVDSIGLPEGFRKDDLQLLTGISNTTAIAIENAKLYEKLKQELDERRHSEEALKESEEQYRVSIESAPYGIGVHEKNGKVLIFNPQAERITGYSKEEIPDLQTWLRKVYPEEEYRKLVMEERKAITQEERPRIREAVITRKDGEKRICQFVSILLPSGLRTVFINDITERKLAEEALRESEKQLYQAQKMEALGSLLSGVAHEINNPINLIMFNIPLLKKIWHDFQPIFEDHAEREPNRKYGGLSYDYLEANLSQLISDMEMASKRIAGIVTNLKNFARRSDISDMKLIKINDAVENSIRLTQTTLKKSGIDLELNLGHDLPNMQGNIQSLEQVFLNLIINAIEAIDHDKGKIRIATGFRTKKKQLFASVSDNGRGIEPSIAERIFDPFVTTRQAEGGTGLGLSVTYNLIKAHGGEITFETKKGEGTTFKISFPVEKERKAAKILVVDDEKPIRDLLTEALTGDQSYLVEQASNGTEALIKLGAYRPDLLILDVLMPDMDGLEVCHLLKKERELSEIKVIVLTGFPNDPRVQKISEMGFEKIYEKPFNLQNLLKEVDSLLGN